MGPGRGKRWSMASVHGMSAGRSVQPDEGEHEAAELCRFLQVHDVTCAFDYDATGIRYAGLDGSRMRVNIWNVRITREYEGGDTDLMQSRQRGFGPQRVIPMSHVLRLR
jgi:hypothetical protein